MSAFCHYCGQPHAADAPECASCGVTIQLFDEREVTRPEARLVDFSPRSYTSLGDEVTETDHARVSRTGQIHPIKRDNAPRALPEDADEAPSLHALRYVEAIPEGALRITLGYDASNDIVIPRPSVSAHHAIIARDMVKSSYFLQDLESTNGTLVNGERVQGVALIKPGDRVSFGRGYSFAFDAQLTQRFSNEIQDARATQALQAISAPDRARQITIGREVDNDIVLDAPQISRHHVRLRQPLSVSEGDWIVEDLGSANGTFLNDRHGAPIHARAAARESDILYMGSYRFPLSRLYDFIDPSSPSIENQRAGLLAMPLDKQVITIGRGSDNDIVLDSPQISRHHARLIRRDKQFFVEDLGSANGTFVNGERVGRALLTPEDTLSLGTYSVRLDLARGALQKSYQGDILLQAEHLRVDVTDEQGGMKRLLDDISFTVYPTEFVGIMGPSGAGKTTLLMSMIGTLRPNHGRTMLNGDDLGAQYDRYRNTIGYVPQEDIIHDELTVYEALYYAAKLRFPPDTSSQEIAARIDRILHDLEIGATRDVRIGSPNRKGISGGQRKRVNLAMELLTEPSLLCLDEPTSGLASEDALNVITLLRRLADGGRTILMTIHQPSPQVYRKLDNVLYLADGEQVYYGPAYPDSMLYFHPEIRTNSPQAEEILADPGSCLRPLTIAKRAGEPMETFAARYRQSAYHREYVEERRVNHGDVELNARAASRRAPRFRFHQLWVLCRRYLVIKLKDRVGMVILIAQAPIIAVLVAMVFEGQEHGPIHRMEYMPFALFLLIISAIWFGCSNAAREIVGEQAIYRRERMVNLSIPAYVGSKFVILSLLSLLQCVALLAIAVLTLDVVGNPLIHLAILWICSLAATGMGLLLSSVVRSTAASLALVPLLLIPQVILGGAIMPIDRMEDPSWTLSGAMISRWGFEAVLQAEHLSDAYELGADDLPAPLGPGLPAPPPPLNPLDRFIGSAETYLPVDFGTLGGFTFVFLLLTATTLRVRERRR